MGEKGKLRSYIKLNFKQTMNLWTIAVIAMLTFAWSAANLKSYYMLLEERILEQIDLENFIIFNLNNPYNVLFLYAFSVILFSRNLGITCGFDILLITKGKDRMEYWKALLVSEGLIAAAFSAAVIGIHFLTGLFGGLELKNGYVNVISAYDGSAIPVWQMIGRGFFCITCYLFGLMLIQNCIKLCVRINIIGMLLAACIPILDMVIYKSVKIELYKYTLMGNVLAGLPGYGPDTALGFFYWCPVLILLCLLNEAMIERKELYGEDSKPAG